MNLQLIRFVQLDGGEICHPRTHLRWLTLDSESRLEAGFSSETVVLTGNRLGKLFQVLATGTCNDVHEEIDRHATKKWCVEKISIQRHT